ncbi:MAG: SDR family oxidoreductase [Thermoleophilaceae bacterium]|nr:SDR family oxidoreductase [Thermoleophilaceae bacterium]
MSERAAIVTGGSSGIGLAIARALGQDGYGLTVSARRPEKLEEAVAGLRDEGLDVNTVAANMASEEDIQRIVSEHQERFGRLDLLANNAGVGIGGSIHEAETKKLDMQLAVNLRAVYLMTRDCIPLLREAAKEHGKALIVNTASIAGKYGQGGLAAYSATKFGVVGLSQATQQEYGGEGITTTALCPGFVATPMTDWIEGEIPKEEMIQPEDIAESVRFLLRTSKNCAVPEIQFLRPTDRM